MLLLLYLLLFSYELVLPNDWISINAFPSLYEKFTSTGDFSRHLEEERKSGERRERNERKVRIDIAKNENKIGSISAWKCDRRE